MRGVFWELSEKSEGILKQVGVGMVGATVDWGECFHFFFFLEQLWPIFFFWESRIKWKKKLSILWGFTLSVKFYIFILLNFKFKFKIFLSLYIREGGD